MTINVRMFGFTSLSSIKVEVGLSLLKKHGSSKILKDGLDVYNIKNIFYLIPNDLYVPKRSIIYFFYTY